MAFDETISTNYLTVLDTANYPYPTALLSGPCVTGGGTNTQIWMADANTNGLSKGVVRWDVTADGAVAAGDTGAVVVGISPSGLDLSAYDVAVDASSNIYVIQCLDGYRDPSDFHQMPRLFRLPALRRPAGSRHQLERRLLGLFSGKRRRRRRGPDRPMGCRRGGRLWQP